MLRGLDSIYLFHSGNLRNWKIRDIKVFGEIVSKIPDCVCQTVLMFVQWTNVSIMLMKTWGSHLVCSESHLYMTHRIVNHIGLSIQDEHYSLGNNSSKLHNLFPDWSYLTCHKMRRSALISYEYFLGHWCKAPELNATCIPGLSHLLVEARQERKTTLPLVYF